MISMHEAFSSQTTTTVALRRYTEGEWNVDNVWSGEGYEAPVDISATPIPIGERQTGTHGENLLPNTTGERTPASMKFTSRTELNLKDILIYRGLFYKMTRKGDFNAAGYFTAVGISYSTFELAFGGG